MANWLPNLTTFDILFSIFFLSLPLGSFYNVVALRTLTGESYMSTNERSHCNSCGHQLHWNDLVPVLSWLLLRGKCRYCDAKIPGFYSLWEFFTAVSYTFFIYRFGFTLDALIQIILITILIWASVTDYTNRAVPKSFIVWGYILIIPMMTYSYGLGYIKILIIAPLALSIIYSLHSSSMIKTVTTDYLMYGLVVAASAHINGVYPLFVGLILWLTHYYGKNKDVKDFFIPYFTLGVLITHVLSLII